MFKNQKNLPDCWNGGLRATGGGTNVVKSNSFSSLFGDDKSISLTYRVEFRSSIVTGKRDIVTLICPGWISRRTASCKIAAASKFDRLINDESLITRSWSFGRRRLS